MKHDQLKEMIETAFHGVKLGDGIGLWEAQARDEYAPEKVQRSAREGDEKHEWTNIPADVLVRCESSLHFFDADGMRFHLPAFLIAEVDSPSDFSLVWWVTDSSEYGRSQFASLNREQRNAVAAFLHWCLEQEDDEFEQEDIRKALDDYWREG